MLINSRFRFGNFWASPTGALDSTFGGSGIITTGFAGGTQDIAYAVTVQTNGKIVLAGRSNWDFAVARYNSDGNLDTTFNSTGRVTTSLSGSFEQAYAVAIQTDGKILAAGYARMANEDFAVIRYNSNGSLDTTFNTTGIVTTAIGVNDDTARALTIQSDGKIVLVGSSHNGANDDFAIIRYR